MNRGDIIVRDVRVKTHFVVDDEYLNGYAKLCGASATMVYLCLCRHADQGQRAFPSIKLMAEKLGVSNMTVIRGIDTLVAHQIIVKGRQRNPKTGRWWHNSYLLQDKKVWIKSPHNTSGTWTPHNKKKVHHITSGASPTYHPANTKDSHSKDSHIRMETSKMLEDMARAKAALIGKKVLH